MGDIEAPSTKLSCMGVLVAILPSKDFVASWKGKLLIGELILTFISFVCFVSSAAAALVTIPLIEFLASLYMLFAYSIKFNEKFAGFHWPLMDFLRCVSAAVIFFIISIVTSSKYSDSSSKAAGVFGFFTTIVFALDFHATFNNLAALLKQGMEEEDEPSRQQEIDVPSDSDSD